MEKLFSNFSIPDKATWMNKIPKEVLQIRNSQNLKMDSIYRLEALKEMKYLEEFHRKNVRYSIQENRVYIKVKDLTKARCQALKALQDGCQGILFNMQSYLKTPLFEELLDPISITDYRISFKIPRNWNIFFERYFLYLRKRKIPLSSLKCNFFLQEEMKHIPSKFFKIIAFYNRKRCSKNCRKKFEAIGSGS